MSWWVELRCDVRSRSCLSHANLGPMRLVHQGKMSLASAVDMRKIVQEAKDAGWRYSDRRWICPKCWEQK